MNRATAGLDRVTAAVAGLALIGVGAAAIAWQAGRLPGNREMVDASPLTTAESASWWLWAVGAAAVVAIALGLRWLVAHRPRRRLGPVVLSGSGSGSATVVGSLTTDLTLAARCAAASMARRPGIVSATGRAVSDRGQRVVEIRAVVDPNAVAGANTGADVGGAVDGETGTAAGVVADAAATVTRDLAVALDGVAVSTRILLGVSRSRRK